MKKYKIWINKREYLIVEAMCPSEAIKIIQIQKRIKWIWDIETVKEHE